MADALLVNSTQVHPDQPCFSYGTTNVVALDWGTPDSELFLDPTPLGDGLMFRGRVAKDRKFTLRLAVADVGSMAKGQDVWQEVLDLLNAHAGLVEYRYVRADGLGGTVDRTLLATVQGEPAWSWMPSGGGDGLRPNGNVVVTASCIAPWPWFRDSDPFTREASSSGTTPAAIVVPRGGQLACGLEVKAKTAGALGSVTVSDGNRSMTLTASFGSGYKGADWYFTDPQGWSADAGVTIGIPASLSLHDDPTTITFTPGGGSTGTHAFRVRWKPNWKAP